MSERTERASNANPGTPVFCDVCHQDFPVWPGEDGRLPAVVHEVGGAHAFRWPDENDPEATP